MQCTAQPLTLAAAAAHFTPSEWTELLPHEVAPTPQECDAAAATWVWLQGLDPASPAAEQARQSLCCSRGSDAGLLVALTAPATEFFDWFKGLDWEDFSLLSHVPRGGVGSRRWGMSVLDRAEAGIEALGVMASQVALRPR